MKTWLGAFGSAVKRGAKWINRWGNVQEKKTPKSTGRKRKQTTRKKVKKRVVQNTFKKVRADVASVQDHTNLLDARIKELESRHNKTEEQGNSNSRWIQHHTQQFTTITSDLSTHNYRLEQLEKLPETTKELQKQFAELIAQFEEKDGTHQASEPSTTPELQTAKELVPMVTKLPSEIVENLTPYSRRAFFIIIQMLQESEDEWLPLSYLAGELYPDREGKNVANVVANVLKPLYTDCLIERRRRANHVFLRPTDIGFAAVKEKVTQGQAKRVDKQIRKLQNKK